MPCLWYQKYGSEIPSQVCEMQPADVIFPMSVIGQFKDYRDFSISQIQYRVNSCWFTNETIRVQKVSETYFFNCTNENDKNNLLAKCSHASKEP